MVNINNSFSVLYPKDIPQYYTGARIHTRTAEPSYDDIQFMQLLVNSVKYSVVLTYLLTYLHTYLLTSLLHGAESFLRS